MNSPIRPSGKLGRSHITHRGWDLSSERRRRPSHTTRNSASSGFSKGNTSTWWPISTESASTHNGHPRPRRVCTGVDETESVTAGGLQSHPGSPRSASDRWHRRGSFLRGWRSRRCLEATQNPLAKIMLRSAAVSRSISATVLAPPCAARDTPQIPAIDGEPRIRARSRWRGAQIGGTCLTLDAAYVNTSEYPRITRLLASSPLSWRCGRCHVETHACTSRAPAIGAPRLARHSPTILTFRRAITRSLGASSLALMADMSNASSGCIRPAQTGSADPNGRGSGLLSGVPGGYHCDARH